MLLQNEKRGKRYIMVGIDKVEENGHEWIKVWWLMNIKKMDKQKYERVWIKFFIFQNKPFYHVYKNY